MASYELDVPSEVPYPDESGFLYMYGRVISVQQCPQDVVDRDQLRRRSDCGLAASVRS